MEHLSKNILRHVIESTDCGRTLLVREALQETIPGYQYVGQRWLGDKGWGWVALWVRVK